MGTKLSVLRLQNVYGPGQSLTNSYTGIVSLFAQRALASAPIDVYEDGAITRDLVHIDDVADALAMTVAQPPSSSRTLDIGSGQPVTIATIALAIARQCRAPAPVVSGRWRDGDVRAAWCDPVPAIEDLGFKAKIGWQEGLRQLVSSIAAAATPMGRAS
jgi:dTDP-L-rhamnose 4-epimerase